MAERALHEEIGRSVGLANARLSIGIPDAEKRAISNSKTIKTVGGIGLEGIAYVDLPRVSKRILDTGGAKEQIRDNLETCGLITSLPKKGKRIYASQELDISEIESIRNQISNDSFAQHVEATNDPRIFNVEAQDHYVGADITESNPIDLVHALHATGLNADHSSKTVLFDDANFLGGELLPEEVIQDHHMLTEFIHGHIEPEEYQLISESKLRRVFMGLNKLIGQELEGECPDYDALLYITKMGRKEEFAEKFSEKHGVDKGKVLDILSELPDFDATHAFVSLPKIEKVGGVDVNAKSQQQSTAKRLEDHGMGHLNGNIVLHLYDLNKMKDIDPRHFETILNPKKRSKEEIADAQIKILTKGKRGLEDVRKLDEDMEKAEVEEEEEPIEWVKSFELQKMIRLAQAYPKVVKKAREEMDIEILPDYLDQIMKSHEETKKELGGEGLADTRYKIAVTLASNIAKDILSWMNVKLPE